MKNFRKSAMRIGFYEKLFLEILLKQIFDNENASKVILQAIYETS